MSLLSSILNLAVVVGAGWFTIYYVIPKIESGEWNIAGISKKKEEPPVSDEPPAVENEIADAAAVEPPKEEKKKRGSGGGKRGSGTKGEKKGKGEWLSSDKAGKDNRKKVKEEFRIIEYLAGDYGYGIY
jgi:hypothetical protein